MIFFTPNLMKNNLLLLAIFILTFAFSLVKEAHAQTCTTQYGGTVTCPPTDLTINKLVAKPREEREESVVDKGGNKQVVTVTAGPLVFVENLTINQSYRPGQEVPFNLVISNGSNKTFTNVTVKDVFPENLTFVSGPGTFSGNTLTFPIDKLDPGQKVTQQILARVTEPKGDTPANFCVLNRGEVSAEDPPAGEAGRFHKDDAQVCVTTVASAKKLPVAGVNEFLMLIPFAGAGLSGIALLRKRI